MEGKLQIIRVNLKHFMLPQILLSIILAILSPVFIGIENLDASRTARVLEMFVALFGIIMLTPLCVPEQDNDIRELVEAKYFSYIKVVMIRILEGLLCLIIITGLYIILLKYNNCSFPTLKFFLGTFAEACFLGALGFCAFVISNQIAIGYLLPFMYYLMAAGGGKKLFRDFYPFSMIYGSYREKINLAVLAVILMAAGLTYIYIYKRIKVKK